MQRFYVFTSSTSPYPFAIVGAALVVFALIVVVSCYPYVRGLDSPRAPPLYQMLHHKKE